MHFVKLLSATTIAVTSGFILYLIPALLLEERYISKEFVIVTFGSGTAVTLYILLKGTRDTADVWARAGLVWTTEWIVAAIVPIYVSWLAFIESGVLTSGNLEAKATAESEAKMAALTGVGICLIMALLSYLLYVIASRCRK
jgi:hypothetical protein